MKNFTLIDRFEVGHVVNEVDSNEDLWHQITARQDAPGSPHHDTAAIFLRWCRERTIEAAFTDLEAIDYPASAEMPASMAMLAWMSEYLSVKQLGRAMIVNLHAGGHIDAHADEGAYAEHYQRFHLCLFSRRGNVFRCGDEETHMRPGDLWTFNHRIEHELWNNSDSMRLHLIFDAVL